MKKIRHQYNEPKNKHNKDTLSDFPDCVLLHILSFLNARDAIRTCVLSSRWKYLWKQLPTLVLSSHHFRTLKGFTKFVTHILSLRDSSTALNALDFKRHGIIEPQLLKRVLRYAFSHNVNHLSLFCDIRHSVPPLFSLFSCSSLTSLDLRMSNLPKVTFPNHLNLPAITYLKLQFFYFCSGNDSHVKPFSTFNRLNTLILCDCFVLGEQTLCLSSTTLLNLTIYSIYNFGQYFKIELFAPNLYAFAFTCTLFLKLSGSHLSSIKQVSIDICEFKHLVETPLGQLNWLIEMTDIESLSVTPRTLQALSLIPDILKLKLHSLCNLKSLQLNMSIVSFDSNRFSEMTQKDIKMELAGGKSWKQNDKLRETIKAGLKPKYSFILEEMVDFLLQNSPSAKVDKVKF